MAILDAFRRPVADNELPQTSADPTIVPGVVGERVMRARRDSRKDANKRRLWQKYWESEQYWYLNGKGELVTNDTVTAVGKKPAHRVRNSYNFLQSIVENKVSRSTQKVPGYEVTASTPDADDMAAARLAQKAAQYGYDQWRMRRLMTKVVTNAFVQREGFVMPYFDPNVGPFHLIGDEWVGEGEIKFLSLCRSEVGWESGVDFDDSRWYTIDRATPVDEIMEIPGFFGGKIKPDATTADLPSEDDRSKDQLAYLTTYLERPSPKFPQGRRMLICGGKVIAPVEPYPVRAPNGDVLDEPPMERLSYTVNPNGDDMGLVERILDLQRTINDCWNKILEWKNRGLNPQMIAPRGSKITRRDDTPGATWFYNVVSGQKPEWEKVPDIPQRLYDTLNLAIEQMRALAADVDVQPDPRLTSQTALAAINYSQDRWQSFLGDLAAVHSRLMRRALTLMQLHYTEERMIEVRGQYGWESIPNFKGSNLRSQVNVRVDPSTLEGQSRQAVMQQIQFIQANWPGAITPEAALGAIRGGNAEGLMRSYEYDVARANEMIQIFRQGPKAAFKMGTRYDSGIPFPQKDPRTGQPVLDPATGQPIVQWGGEVPAWMPRPQDNLMIHRQVVGDYMKTPDFSNLPPETQYFFNEYWDGLEFLAQIRAQREAMQQTQQAESLGMMNAGKPQGPTPMPDRTGLNPNSPSATPPGQTPPAQGA